MEDFKIGDVVVLKSGGVKMVVNHIEGNKVETTWPDGKTQEPKFAEFNKAVLKIFEEEKPHRSTSVPIVVDF